MNSVGQIMTVPYRCIEGNLRCKSQTLCQSVPEERVHVCVYVFARRERNRESEKEGRKQERKKENIAGWTDTHTLTSFLSSELKI